MQTSYLLIARLPVQGTSGYSLKVFLNFKSCALALVPCALNLTALLSPSLCHYSDKLTELTPRIFVTQLK